VCWLVEIRDIRSDASAGSSRRVHRPSCPPSRCRHGPAAPAAIRMRACLARRASVRRIRRAVGGQYLLRLRPPVRLICSVSRLRPGSGPADRRTEPAPRTDRAESGRSRQRCALRCDRTKRRTVALRTSGRVALAVAHQGSHRPVRARMRAYGSSADRFAAPEGSPWLSVRVPWTCG
jgi:hypothetical protein